MIEKIKTIDDVKQFFKDLIGEDLNFHPDTPFEDYINGDTKEPTYTKDEAAFRDGLMDRAFEVCRHVDVDIYDLSMEIFLLETGMDKFIPLPSSFND